MFNYNEHSINTTPRSQRVVTFALPGPASGSSSLPATPKSRGKGTSRRLSRTNSELSSPNRKASPPNVICFAGSKITDSPSARTLPPPPVGWFDEMLNGSISDSETGSVAESYSSMDSQSSFTGSDCSRSTSPASSITGVRFDPLHLIAAVAVRG